jgi:hypothetical protein
MFVRLFQQAAGPEAADGKRGIQWRDIIRQAFDKARQTQQPRTTRRELSKDKSKSLVVLGGAAVAMLLLFLGIFSSPQKAKRTEGRAGAPDLGRRTTPGQERGQSASVAFRFMRTHARDRPLQHWAGWTTREMS